MSVKGKRNRKLTQRVLEKIRRPIAPPGKAHKHANDYNRKDRSWEVDDSSNYGLDR